MLPFNSLSDRPVPAPIEGSRTKQITPKHDYEDGGRSLHNVIWGYQDSEWECYVDCKGIWLGKVNEEAKLVLPGRDITEVSFTFNKDMNPIFAYKESSKFYLGWIQGKKWISKEVNGKDLKLILDDKRIDTEKNVLLFFVRENNLFYSSNVDNFFKETPLEIKNSSGRTMDILSLIKVGIGSNGRLIFEGRCEPRYLVEDRVVNTGSMVNDGELLEVSESTYSLLLLDSPDPTYKTPQYEDKTNLCLTESFITYCSETTYPLDFSGIVPQEISSQVPVVYKGEFEDIISYSSQFSSAKPFRADEVYESILSVEMFGQKHNTKESVEYVGIGYIASEAGDTFIASPENIKDHLDSLDISSEEDFYNKSGYMLLPGFLRKGYDFDDVPIVQNYTSNLGMYLGDSTGKPLVGLSYIGLAGVILKDSWGWESWGDKTELGNLIQESNTLNSSDYPRDVWDNFQITLNNSIAVYNSEDANFLKIRSATTSLDAALSNMKNNISRFTLRIYYIQEQYWQDGCPTAAPDLCVICDPPAREITVPSINTRNTIILENATRSEVISFLNSRTNFGPVPTLSTMEVENTLSSSRVDTYTIESMGICGFQSSVSKDNFVAQGAEEVVDWFMENNPYLYLICPDTFRITQNDRTPDITRMISIYGVQVADRRSLQYYSQVLSISRV